MEIITVRNNHSAHATHVFHEAEDTKDFPQTKGFQYAHECPGVGAVENRQERQADKTNVKGIPWHIIPVFQECTFLSIQIEQHFKYHSGQEAPVHDVEHYMVVAEMADKDGICCKLSF